MIIRSLLSAAVLAAGISLAAADAFDEDKSYKPGVQDVPMIYKEIRILWPEAKRWDTVWLAELQKHAAPGLYAGIRDSRYPVYGKPDKDKRKHRGHEDEDDEHSGGVPEPFPVVLLGVGLMALGWRKRSE